MRAISLALLGSVLVSLTARAADLRYFDDTSLRAVHFINDKEGWVAGDDGAVWHTLDGGKVWEHQPTGVRGSLCSIHFVDFETGWIAGREELPGGGSAGVLLFTDNGGEKWQRVHAGNMSGLHVVKFTDPLHGFVVGEGTELDPTGVYRTSDGGHTWEPIKGARGPAWLGADFRDKNSGVLVGAWSRLAVLSDGAVTRTSIDKIGARNVHAIALTGAKGENAVAVGDGGLILFSDGAGGAEWKWPRLDLPPEVLSSLDFHAVSCVGKQVWIAGRPGSIVLHSPDRGNTWEALPTGQPLPLHAIQFVNESVGWAAGDLGTVLGTTDGGKTWQMQRRGGQRAAGLFVHARATGLPTDALAQLGADEGYLLAALRVVSPDPESASLQRAADPQRFAAAVRLAGGAAGEMLWQFPLPQHSGRIEKAQVLKSWDHLHDDRGAEQMLRQLVLAMRIWQPDVIITDHTDEKIGSPVEALIAEAVQEAYKQAVDPKAFPEQIGQLGLAPCKAGKLYACWNQAKGAQVVLDPNAPSNRLQTTPDDYTLMPQLLLGDQLPSSPSQRCFRLVASSMEGADQHQFMFQGASLAPGGTARRNVRGNEVQPITDADRRAMASADNLRRLAAAPAGELNDPAKTLAQLTSLVSELPERMVAPTIFKVANEYVRAGQWMLAREAYLLLVTRYPSHALAPAAYRWLIRYGSSSEARQRQELGGQFIVATSSSVEAAPRQGTKLKLDRTTPSQTIGNVHTEGVAGPLTTTTVQRTGAVRGAGTAPGSEEFCLRQWHESSLALESRLAAFGRIQALDPGMQFCLNASRRATGHLNEPLEWCSHFITEHTEGPWHGAAQAELWLNTRQGPPPKPLALCALLDKKPYLDGELDDDCWKDVKPIALKNAVGDTIKEYPTQVRIAYDREFLYLTLRCEHPEDCYVPRVKQRPRDADLRAFDRVTLMLDLDRDYTTSFNLHIDQRGCVCEDCWGDLSWNPQWFVACHSEKTCWQIEAAIPLMQLTSDRVSPGQAWACNVVRILPGRGVQAFSTPADVLPRPEGMGLLMFGAERKPGEQPK